MIFDGLSNQDVLDMAREDWRAARESRRDIEQRKLRDYKLYRRWREDVFPSGGTDPDDTGPHGWSKITVPLVFWITETILPRVGVQPPTLTVNPRNTQSVAYAQAKQLRIQRQLNRGAAEEHLLLGIKQFLVLGDGPLKMAWSRRIGGPRLIAIDWFDWYLSPDARMWHESEVIWHRTWHTKRDLQQLSKMDGERKDQRGNSLPRLYDRQALEDLAYGSAYREAEDPLYIERREASGLGTTQWGNMDGQIAILEGHYRDGSRVWIAGDDSPLLLRLEREPQLTDGHGHACRPFAVLQNTPDLFLPYSISDAEMLEDHQHEASTFRNAAIDQATGNIHQPKGINRNLVRPEDVRRAFEEPNGSFEVDGDPMDAVRMFPPGQLSGDFERIYENVRSEAQMVSGVSDISAGQPTSFGLDNSTATGMSIIREESNQRYRMKLKLIQIGFRRVAEIYHYMDRSISMSPVDVPVDRGFQQLPGAKGLDLIGEGFASVGVEVNAPGLDYDIEVDASSMAPPHQLEQAQKTRAFIQDASHPMIMPMVNWPEVARMLAQSHGLEPEKVLIQGQLPVQVENVAEPGEVPDGPPEPVESNAPQGQGLFPADSAATPTPL
ncbi:MAG TPA: hypothetical protein VJP59_00225 [Gemmatimonadota bacterium]|nr:hypothetical protein [Gemmatimonadota bacterium]